MPLFQQSVIKKHIESFNAQHIEEKWQLFQAIFHTAEKQQNIRKSKEEQYQEGFLRDLFVGVFGYIINPEPNFNLLTEQKNVNNSKKADGAIVIDGKAVAVIELKGTETTDLNKIEVQAFGYKSNQPGCNYVIVSNFEKLRFYIDNTTQQEEFNLFTLTKPQFEVLYACLSWESISKNTPMQILNESVSKENIITNKLYKDYSEFKRALFANLVELNPEFDKLLLFKKTQKLLDRFLFVFFAEDRLLLPTNLIFRINKEWENIIAQRIQVSLYDRYKMYFNDLNVGAKVTLPAFGKKTGEAITAEFQIFAYNGGLFQPDEVLDQVNVDDSVLFTYTERLSHYNFESDVDVNILGHIFENSLNEIDEIKSEIEGNTLDKTKTRRKKDGVFYTPKYITKYIVENTVGKLCSEKKVALKLNDEDYITDKKLQTKTKKALLDKLADYRNWLLDLTICDPACGSGAFLNQALEFLIAEHRYIDELQAKLLGDSLVLSDIENSILERNIYGVDLNDESVEIAKLSLWLRTAQKGRKLNSLNNNIKCGNSLIDDPVVAGDKAFNWEEEFPEVFARGGFDVVIGNPPYVQLQTMGKIAVDLEKLGYKSYEKTGDLYCLFYEIGNIILKNKGLLGFITSNKWMRGNYGKSLRNYFATETNPKVLIDLGSGIFTSATVDSNILITEKKKVKEHNLLALDISKEKIFSDFSVYLKDTILIKQLTDEIWTISDATLQNIENKINVGKKLKDWKISINYGVKTGYNEAFIISKERRQELVSKDPKSGEILKPILRGRDIRKYSYDFADLYLINSHNGYKSINAVDIDNYFAIKEFLNSHWDKIEKRSDKGRTPYNLRNCAYIDKFEIPKIIYPETTVRRSEFVYDEEGIYLDKTCFFISGEKLKFLNAILNSKLYEYYLENKLRLVGSNTIQYSKQYITEVPIIEISETSIYEQKVDLITSNYKIYRKLNTSFLDFIQSQFSIEKLSKKLQSWHDLTFSDFIKELNKAIKIAGGTPLTKLQEMEWMEVFETKKKEVLELKAEIDKTDKEIDRMVYELYGLSEEEVKIVEGS